VCEWILCLRWYLLRRHFICALISNKSESRSNRKKRQRFRPFPRSAFNTSRRCTFPASEYHCPVTQCITIDAFFSMEHWYFSSNNVGWGKAIGSDIWTHTPRDNQSLLIPSTFCIILRLHYFNEVKGWRHLVAYKNTAKISTLICILHQHLLLAHPSYFRPDNSRSIKHRISSSQYYRHAMSHSGQSKHPDREIESPPTSAMAPRNVLQSLDPCSSPCIVDIPWRYAVW
jgi:hypothetical protein